ncbi:MAG: YMGG-like glycine zipper-containing protein [Polymorphobacter sp.]
MNALKTPLLLFAALGSLAACTTDQYGNQQASRGLKGAGIGAAGGAIVGAITGGDVLAGAAIGAAAGAVVGIVTEDRNRYEDRNGQRYYYDNQNQQYWYDKNRRKHYGRR